MIDPNADTPTCPICGGRMEVVYNRSQQIVAVCVDCHSGVTIPAKAREVVRLKRSGDFNRQAP